MTTKRVLSVLCGVLCAFSFPLASVAQQSNTDKKPEIAMLGMFHFGSTSDLAAIVMDDVKGEKRQREIQEVIDRLKEYNPTKVLVEYPMSKQDTLQSRYESFKNGGFALPTSETYQIGFRLARQLGHDTIYAIDHKMDLPFNDIVAYCQENNCMDKFQNIVNFAQSYTANETKVLKEMKLATFLLRQNSSESDRFGNGLYLREILDIGDPANEVGARITSIWYQRNMIIMKNILDLVENEDERLLVIIGASHRAVIHSLLENRTEFRFVEIADYLKD